MNKNRWYNFFLLCYGVLSLYFENSLESGICNAIARFWANSQSFYEWFSEVKYSTYMAGLSSFKSWLGGFPWCLRQSSVMSWNFSTCSWQEVCSLKWKAQSKERGSIRILLRNIKLPTEGQQLCPIHRLVQYGQKLKKTIKMEVEVSTTLNLRLSGVEMKMDVRMTSCSWRQHLAMVNVGGVAWTC